MTAHTRPKATARRLALLLLIALSLVSTCRAGWIWSDDIRNLSSSLRNARPPRIAGNQAGQAAAVWVLNNGNNLVLQSAQLDNSTWGPTTRVNRLGENAAQPDVAMDGNGNARAVWVNSDGITEAVATALYRREAAGWNTPLALSEPGILPDTPRVAMNATGQAVATWISVAGNSRVLQARLLLDGNWSRVYQLSRSQENASEPQVAIGPGGHVTVVWTSSLGSFSSIESIHFENGQWTTVVPLTTMDGIARQPQLAVDENGEVTVVWLQAGGGGLYYVLSRRFANGGWSQATLLSPLGENANSPQVAASLAGVAMAMWMQQRPDGVWVIRSRRYQGGAWNELPDFVANLNAAFPRIAMDASGNATAAWTRSNGTLDLIRGSHYQDGGWSPSAVLSQASQKAELPQVTMQGKNRAAVVWLANHGAVGIVQASLGRYVAQHYTLKVSRTGTPGAGAVTSTPSGIDCGKTCNASFLEGTKITLLAAPAADSNFLGWSGACQGTKACELRMNQNREVSARFVASADYKLKVQRPGNGLVSSEPAGISCGGQEINCQQAFGKDAVVTLSATPKAGYQSGKWTGCPAAEGSRCTVTLTRPTTTVQAQFKPLPKYTLDLGKTRFGSVASAPAGLTCGNQARRCQARFTAGTAVTLTATPAAGHRFVGWGDGCSGTDPACQVQMDGRRKVSARFE